MLYFGASINNGKYIPQHPAFYYVIYTVEYEIFVAVQLFSVFTLQQ